MFYGLALLFIGTANDSNQRAILETSGSYFCDREIPQLHLCGDSKLRISSSCPHRSACCSVDIVIYTLQALAMALSLHFVHSASFSSVMTVLRLRSVVRGSSLLFTPISPLSVIALLMGRISTLRQRF